MEHKMGQSVSDKTDAITTLLKNATKSRLLYFDAFK